MDPQEIWIAYRSDELSGDGTQANPYNGKTQAMFDDVMAELAELPDSIRVHLGPSPRNTNGDPLPFITAGFSISSGGTTGSAWLPKPGMSLVGAGRDATYLRLAPGATAGTHYYAIGAPTTSPVDFFEVSDMTIDCNQSTNGVACGAVRLMGNHIRVRNIRCINWGNRTTGTTAQPGFVVALIVGDPDSGLPMASADDAIIEDCIAVSPSTNNSVTGPMEARLTQLKEAIGVS